jgi:hypothetical protein
LQWQYKELFMGCQICTGSFTNVASTPFFVPLEQYVSEFRIKNLTRSGVAVGSVDGALTATRIVEAFFNQAYQNAGTAQIIQTSTVSGNHALMNIGNLKQNGITIFNAANQPIYPVIAVASFTPGTTTVWTTSAPHGYQVGDTVRVYNLVSSPQFSGLGMTVTAVGSTTTFTTLLDSTGATTSVGSVIKIGNYLIPNKSLYYPENRVIAKITNANPMVVTTLVQQNYYVGDVVTFDIPSIFGVPQLSAGTSGLPFQATVIAANNAVGTQTVTLAVNSTNFGVFATSAGATVTNPGHWPLAPGYPFSFPFMVPQGEGNINNWQSFNITPSPLPYANQDVLSFARQNLAFNGVLVGAGDGTDADTTGGIIGSTVDVFEWRAITSDQEFPPLLTNYV